MNVSRAKKMIVASALAPACLLAGCAGMTDTGQAADNLEPRIAGLVEANRNYPQWSAFPAAPTDIPGDAVVAAEVSTLKVSAGALTGEVARIQWLVSNAEAYEADIRSRVRSAPAAVDTAATLEEIEAFQQRLRDRGRAPPPVDRRR